MEATYNKDRISEMPEEIVDQILSLLPARDAVRMSVLSKTWQQVSKKLLPPVVSFIFGKDFFKENSTYKLFEWNMRHTIPKKEHDRLLKLVDESLSKALVQNKNKVIVQKFQLSLPFPVTMVRKVASHVNRWLSTLVTRNTVDLLQIHFDECYHDFVEKLVLDVGRLMLRGVIMRKGLLGDDSRKLFCLRELSLDFIYIQDAKVLNDMLSRCPLLESIILRGIFNGDKDFGILQLCNFPKLKNVDINNVSGFSRIHIQVPNLELLKFSYLDWMELPIFCSVHLVKHLWIDYDIIATYPFIDKLISQIPVIESLFLENLKVDPRLRALEISSQHLKRLAMHFVTIEGQEGVINIHAPYLYGYSFKGIQVPTLHYTNFSCLQEVDLVLRPRNLDTLWFINLRKKLAVFDGLEADVTVTIDPFSWEKIDFIYSKIGESSVPLVPLRVNYLKVVNIPPPHQHLDYITLLNALFWSSHPKTLSMIPDNKYDYKFEEYICFELLSHRKKKEDCCKEHGTFKCWAHHLKDIDVKIETDHGTLSLKSFLENALYELQQAICDVKSSLH